MDLAKLIQMLMQQHQVPETTEDPDGWLRKMLPITPPEEHGQSLEDLMYQRSPGLINQMQQGLSQGSYDTYKRDLLNQELIRQQRIRQLKGLM